MEDYFPNDQHGQSPDPDTYCGLDQNIETILQMFDHQRERREAKEKNQRPTDWLEVVAYLIRRHQHHPTKEVIYNSSRTPDVNIAKLIATYTTMEQTVL